MKKIFANAALLASGMAMLSHAAASGALNVDDAAIVEPHACQLESWLRFNRDGSERWIMPACNATGNLEVAAGGALQRDVQGLYMAHAQIQLKTVLKKLQTNGVGIGLIAGADRESEAGSRENFRHSYAKIPLSVSLWDDALSLHANLGVHYANTQHTARMTWGLGMEKLLSRRFTLIAEIYGEDKGKPSYQAGLRAVLVPEGVDLSATFGNAFGRESAGQFVALAIRFHLPGLLP
ncbi:hypothetical protein [Collimonas silvisoli]|uniref:hypothetical protein n=1 Tax=Collimonas silvisoli TaxID=2825884 RepID=UPI001B8D36E9|nr:hypothetical protein [Collimonas silvisoli]